MAATLVWLLVEVLYVGRNLITFWTRMTWLSRLLWCYWLWCIMSAIALLPIFSRGPVPRSSLYKYICCKKYGCASALVGIGLLCGMYFCGQVRRLCPIEFQDLDSIAYTVTMNSSNEQRPVKLLALGNALMILACRYSFWLVLTFEQTAVAFADFRSCSSSKDLCTRSW